MPARDNPPMRNPGSLCRLAVAFALAFIDPRSARALDSRVLQVGESGYRVVTLDLGHDALDLYWLDADGRPYANIEALRRKGEAEHRNLLFATNAGIYDRDYRPLGLTIADGKVLRPLNTVRVAGRSGNFGMQPNGVFYIDRQGHAGVVTTADWRARGIEARIATQSGPMLVVDGTINSGFVEDSDSRKWRSGVCARTADNVVFVVSEVPVTFHAFARVFRDELGCGNALYLDGTLSQIYTATEGYSGAPAVMVKPYAGMLAVFANMPASQ
jgi:uncharacterized protein YigE (DUF2233 family)